MNNSKRYLYPCLAVFFLAILAQKSFAYCTPSTTSPTITFPTTAVQGDLPVGTVIATAPVSTITMVCDPTGLDASEGSWYIYLSPENYSAGAPVSGLDNVVPTGIPGIGLRWENWNSSNGTTGRMTNTQLNDSTKGRGVKGNSPTETIKDNFYIVKTGPIQVGSQSISINPISIKYRSIRSLNMVAGNLYTFQFTPFTLTNMTCTIDDSNINVPLGSFPQSSFQGVGSTSNTVNFNIGFSCVSGTRINMTLSDLNAISGFVGTIGLEGSDAATGIGIQVVDSGGTPLSLGDNHVLLESSDAKASISFGAHYIQTTSNITPGSGNAVLVFTINYI